MKYTTVIGAVVLVIALFAGGAYVKSVFSAANKEAGFTDLAPPEQRPKQERVETELITLQQTGFEPNEIKRPQGVFILGVDNRTGLEAIDLRLVRADGQRLNILQTRKRKLSWREVVDLAPGQYLLSEANHPDWTCSVVILPR